MGIKNIASNLNIKDFKKFARVRLSSSEFLSGLLGELQELALSLALAAIAIAFIFIADNEDDDDEGGGMMQPVYLAATN